MNRGYPEGTPLPSMLSNIVLNEPDQELEGKPIKAVVVQMIF